MKRYALSLFLSCIIPVTLSAADLESGPAAGDQDHRSEPDAGTAEVGPASDRREPHLEVLMSPPAPTDAAALRDRRSEPDVPTERRAVSLELSGIAIPVSSTDASVDSDEEGGGSRRRRHAVSRETQAESDVDIARYYDRDKYIGDHVQKLILKEASYDARSTAYNFISVAFMWGAGISGGTTAIVSTLGGASIIPPHVANVTTACLTAVSGVCVWASLQCKKSAKQYHDASKDIQLKLGLPKKLISPQVDIRIDPFRQEVSMEDGRRQTATLSSFEMHSRRRTP